MLRYHHGDHHWQICAKTQVNVQCPRNSYTLELLPSHENSSFVYILCANYSCWCDAKQLKDKQVQTGLCFLGKNVPLRLRKSALATAAAGRREAEPFKFHTSTFFDDFWWRKNVTFDGSYVHTTAIAAARHFWIIPPCGDANRLVMLKAL